jgi:hypothetical protein
MQRGKTGGGWTVNTETDFVTSLLPGPDFT